MAKALDRSGIIPVRGESVPEFDDSLIVELVWEAVEPVDEVEVRHVTAYEFHYLDHRNQSPLPALLVRLNDTGNAMFYIDPRTGRVVQSYVTGSRLKRWLYQKLHSAKPVRR